MRVQWTYLALYAYSLQRSSHLGFDLASSEEVDAIAEEAGMDGLLKFGPTFLNSYAWYLCVISDPDGHLVEFSYGQAVGGNHLTKRVPHKSFLGSWWEDNFDVG